eukprot:152883-Rhodomonas_salina.3
MRVAIRMVMRGRTGMTGVRWRTRRGVTRGAHRSLDDLENGEEKLVNSEAALGGSELLADGLHVMLR